MFLECQSVSVGVLCSCSVGVCVGVVLEIGGMCIKFKVFRLYSLIGSIVF